MTVTPEQPVAKERRPMRSALAIAAPSMVVAGFWWGLNPGDPSGTPPHLAAIGSPSGTSMAHVGELESAAGGGPATVTGDSAAPVRELIDPVVVPAAGSSAVHDHANGEVLTDAELTTLIIGTWHQKRHGDRTLTVLADGTAVMAIRPEALYALAFGERIELDLFWSVRDGRIDYGITGGRPADKVKSARKVWGDHWLELIERLDDETLILRDAATDAPSEWKRSDMKDAQ